MSIEGTFQHVRNENLLEYFKSVGVPEDRAKQVDSAKPKLEVVVDGKKILMHSDSGAEKHTLTFILGEEVEERMYNNTTIKNTAELDGSTLTVKSKMANGKSGARVFKFSDSELVMTLYEDGGSIVAKRFFKRV